MSAREGGPNGLQIRVGKRTRAWCVEMNIAVACRSALYVCRRSFSDVFVQRCRGEEESSAGHTPVPSSTSSPPPLISRIAACPSFRLSSAYNPPSQWCILRIALCGSKVLMLLCVSLVNSRSGARTLRSQTRCVRARTRRRARPGASALRTRARSTRPLWASFSLLCVEEVCAAARVRLTLVCSLVPPVLFELARLVFL
jgi:hypothetical protein